MPPETEYDLAVAWISKSDAPFIEFLETACRAKGLSLLQITPVNLESITADLQAKKISVRALLDRFSDEDDHIFPVIEWARDHNLLWINPYEKALRARDKVLMHQDLFQHLRTPYTLIVPSFNEQPELGPIDTSPLGASFASKPSMGGGGEGVIVLCTTIDDLQTARKHFPEDRYLLQERVVPSRLAGRAAWFRVIFNAGKIYPFWWDTESHLYTPVTVVERYHFQLASLEDITAKIAGICGLQLFSTEIALSKKGEFHVVDYVNDPLDLTPISAKSGGIPDDILQFIAEDLVEWLASNLREGVKKRRAKRRRPASENPPRRS